MHSIVTVNPFRCRVWSLHDRLEGEITEVTCKAELESFAKHGQLIPVLGRPIASDPYHDVELICGARRLFAARHINVPLKVDLRELSDHDAIIAMDIENRQRVDVSPYERGISYAQWLREGYFKSQEDLSRALKVSASMVSRLLKMSKLPSVIVNAFRSPLEIREEWALDLIEALKDPARRSLTVQRARAIASCKDRPQAREVFQRLLVAPTEGRRRRSRAHDEIVRSRSGLPLFRIRRQANAIALLLPLQKVSDHTLDDVRRNVAAILEAAAEDEPAVAARIEPARAAVVSIENSNRSYRGSAMPAASG